MNNNYSCHANILLSQKQYSHIKINVNSFILNYLVIFAHKLEIGLYNSFNILIIYNEG